MEQLIESAAGIRVGDIVDVLRAGRAPRPVRGRGRVLRITAGIAGPLFWIEGFPMARGAADIQVVAE